MMELSQYDQAIEHLNKAWGIFRIPQIAIMKAKALQSKGDLTTALMVLKGIVSDDERIRTRVGAAIAELEAELAKPIEIDVTTSVDQVRMVIDKTSTFLIPGRITVTPDRTGLNTRPRVTGQRPRKGHFPRLTRRLKS